MKGYRTDEISFGRVFFEFDNFICPGFSCHFFFLWTVQDQNIRMALYQSESILGSETSCEGGVATSPAN